MSATISKRSEMLHQKDAEIAQLRTEICSLQKQLETVQADIESTRAVARKYRHQRDTLAQMVHSVLPEVF